MNDNSRRTPIKRLRLSRGPPIIIVFLVACSSQQTPSNTAARARSYEVFQQGIRAAERGSYLSEQFSSLPLNEKIFFEEGYYFKSCTRNLPQCVPPKSIGEALGLGMAISWQNRTLPAQALGGTLAPFVLDAWGFNTGIKSKLTLQEIRKICSSWKERDKYCLFGFGRAAFFNGDDFSYGFSEEKIRKGYYFAQVFTGAKIPGVTDDAFLQLAHRLKSSSLKATEKECLKKNHILNCFEEESVKEGE